MTRFTLAPALLGAAIAVFSLTGAQAQGQRPPGGLPIGEVASELGVSEDALAACLPKPPAQGSNNSSSERPPAPDLNEIASCLKMDSGSVEAVFKKFAPKR